MGTGPPQNPAVPPLNLTSLAQCPFFPTSCGFHTKPPYPDPGTAKQASPIQAANCAVRIQGSAAASLLGPGHPSIISVVPMGSSHSGH